MNSEPQVGFQLLTQSIREAIRDELVESSRGMPFRVADMARDGGQLHLVLDPEGRRSILDESMEEGRLKWEGEIEGSGEVVSVLPAVSVLNGYLTTGRPPGIGTIVYVNPPRYLEALLALWEDEALASRFARWIFTLGENGRGGPAVGVAREFSDLRPAQKKAFELLRWRIGFLWGPPGTGKTHTLGRLLACYLTQFPAARVLLLSSTNVAVDLATLSVEDAVAKLNPARRPVCYRFGSRFDPEKFRERKHLIPLHNRELITMLKRHMESVPDPADAEKYREWRKERDRLRAAIRQENLDFLNRARLVAMTSTLAAHDFQNIGKFDLVVFDEASQIGKVSAATFSELGTRVLFAGDPKQLSPIAQSGSQNVTRWLGASPFEWTARTALQSATCMLDEQWRMAGAINDAVSRLFYESRLRVAEPCHRDAAWLQTRQALPGRLSGTANVVLVDTQAAAQPARQFCGYQCHESARLIVALLVDHVLSWNLKNVREEVLVLTPYRAQRRRISDELRSVQLPVSLASTVHRAQGSEKRIVIFDPVAPTADFVSGDDGMRLVNVAFSRAKCRLIVMLQEGWQENSALAYLARRWPPIVLDSDTVESLLLNRLGLDDVRGHRPVLPPRPVAPVPAVALPQVPLPQQFQRELRERFFGPATMVEVRNAARDVRDRLRYRTLSYQEVEEAVQEVLRQLPRR